MNARTTSTLPARNPTTRPVSFHSLSEHNRNSPSHLSPYSHRRPRTPRSSPLAGPSVSSEEVNGEKKDDEGSQKPRYRPNRISSTPDMVPRVQSLYESNSSSFPSSASPLSTGTSGIVIAPVKSSDSSSSGESEGREEPEDGSRFRNFTKRLSAVSTSSLATSETDKESRKGTMRRSEFLRSTSTTSLASTSSSRTARTDPAPPIPTIPRWALNAMREEAGIANRNMKYGHRRGTSDDLNSSSSLPPLPNQPIPRGAPLSASDLANQQRLPSTSRDPSQNWVSMTDPIPRFSRLSLRAEGVVLPVSKKESLSKMKSSGSIKSAKSFSSISQPAASRPDSGIFTRTEPSPGTGPNPPNVTITESNLKEQGLRKRSYSAGSLKSRIPKISVSSTDRENVPSLPPSINQLGSGMPSDSNSHTPMRASNDSVRNAPTASPFPTIVPTSNPRRSTASKRECALAAIDELPSPICDDSEIGVKVVDVKPQDTQKTRARRKSGIKQIVMRVTMAPICSGEKLKFGAVHKSTVVLPHDTLIPLDPPPASWLGNSASSSVPSLASTVETSDGVRSLGGARSGGKKFKSLRKRWNAVLETIRR